ncbi:MarR family winged helix-turn-helix transcriptional regulator [Levilactobacillus zymae]|uniref:Transcriptional regulator, MarR family n=1 Tax=Levilactobacillus zymae TaxID=267363 RepID=A0A1Y6JU38_9LACO|nr:MarR family winged helix-turn-helix transcriptional regulator [Levilactobacillus zymae]SMS13330.1 Transcriptional regulator, MarR family [Levilactobacillus zymae]
MTPRLGGLLRDATNQMNLELNNFARPYGLTGMQMSVIDYLARRGTTTTYQVDVEHEFAIQRSTASLLVRRMVDRQLVTRVVAASDSRKRQLELTTKGRELVPVITAHLEQQDAKMVAGLSPEAAAGFRQALQRIKQW